MNKMEYNIMTEDKFEKIKNLNFTAKQLQLCKETEVDIEQERKAFIQWHLDRNKTRKSPSMAFTKWLHKNNKIQTYLAEKKVLEKDVLKVEKYLGQPTGTRYEKTMNKILKDWEGLICSVS